jgi:hypothetical protein
VSGGEVILVYDFDNDPDNGIVLAENLIRCNLSIVQCKKPDIFFLIARFVIKEIPIKILMSCSGSYFAHTLEYYRRYVK